jgi:hypothetical protein
MNIKVRDYLIQKAFDAKTVTYQEVSDSCDLGLKMTDGDFPRAELGRILAEIGKFEFNNKRPILSSIVLKSKESIAGNGFFNLCEQLGIGSAKKLKAEDFHITQINESFSFWKENLHIVELQKQDSLPFFTKEDLGYFKECAGKKYRKNDDNSKQIGAKLKKSVYKKTEFWANSIKVAGYTVKHDRLWQISGSFKKYTWARVFKPGDKDKHIFFTVGIGINGKDKPCLLYKLDCQWSEYSKKGHLSANQVQKFRNYIKSTNENVKWVQIEVDELENYNWEKLINTTNEFIEKYSYLYDEVIDYVWNDSFTPTKLKNTILETNKPESSDADETYSKPKFKGVDIDFEKVNKERKDLGDAGENLVLLNEKNLLVELGLIELSEKVQKVKDGEGYDVLSFNRDGSEKYIEVKTTKGGKKSPFYISANELSFSELNADSYCIYRIYEFNEDLNSGAFYIIKGDEMHSFLKLKPMSYIAHI